MWHTRHAKPHVYHVCCPRDHATWRHGGVRREVGLQNGQAARGCTPSTRLLSATSAAADAAAADASATGAWLPPLQRLCGDTIAVVGGTRTRTTHLFLQQTLQDCLVEERWHVVLHRHGESLAVRTAHQATSEQQLLQFRPRVRGDLMMPQAASSSEPRACQPPAQFALVWLYASAKFRPRAHRGHLRNLRLYGFMPVRR